MVARQAEAGLRANLYLGFRLAGETAPAQEAKSFRPEEPMRQTAHQYFDMSDTFEEAAHRIFRRSLEPGEETPPVLYHYTTWAALEGILCSKRMWLFDAATMEDKQELRWADPAIDAAVSELYIDARGMARQALRKFGQVYKQAAIHQMAAIHLTCFCPTGDKSVLFDRFAGNGSGVALGLKMLRNEKFPNDPLRAPHVVPVTYEDRRIRESVSQHFADLMALKGMKDCDPNDWINWLLRTAAIAALRAKDFERFHDEEEWRLIIMTRTADLSKMGRQKHANGRYYVPYPLRPNDLRPAIAEIVLGPKQEGAPDPDERARAILRKAGYPKPDSIVVRPMRSQG